MNGFRGNALTDPMMAGSAEPDQNKLRIEQQLMEMYNRPGFGTDDDMMMLEAIAKQYGVRPPWAHGQQRQPKNGGYR